MPIADNNNFEHVFPATFMDGTPFVPVDEWKPISKEQEVFSSIGDTIYCDLLTKGTGFDNTTEFPYFNMKPKKAYSSVVKVDKNTGKLKFGFKEHYCTYINYLESYYDINKILVAVYGQIKILIDSDNMNHGYSEEEFMNDLYRYIISYERTANPQLHDAIHQMVMDNYYIHQTYKNDRNKCLEYNDDHARLLIELSILQNVIIPVVSHYLWKKKYPKTEINRMFLRCFDMIINEIHRFYNIDLGAKLYETASTNIIKNSNNNKVLWNMQFIRSRDTTTQSIETVENILLQISPKYTFNKNMINFNFNAIETEIQHKVTGITYGYHLSSVSSSDRDEDNNSQADKFEAHIAKIDEAIVIQSNVNCQEAMKFIENKYGPFSEAEIEFYINMLTLYGKPLKNSFQYNLVKYPFMKLFQDTQAIGLLNNHQYIELMLACKRLLLSKGQKLLPFIISGRFEKLVSRKSINKKLTDKIQKSELFAEICNKYNNEKIENELIIQQIAQIMASSVYNIDMYDKSMNLRLIPTQELPTEICYEYMQYVLMI